MYVRQFWLPVKRDQYSWLQKVNALAPILLFPAGIVAYTIYLGYTKGNPLLVQYEEAAHWHRHFDWIWITYAYSVKLLFTLPLFSGDAINNLLDVVFTTFPIVAIVWGWKRLPLHYSLFALAVIVFSLSVPLETVNPLTSQPRYMLAAFPFIVILALWGKRPRFDQFFMALGPPLLALNTILFIGHYWVA
jgi:hypothetical protein